MARERQTITTKDVKEAPPLTPPAGEVKGEGLVLPAAPGKKDLPKGNVEVKVDGFDQSGTPRVIYPDGFVKHHDTKDVNAMAQMIVRNMRARFARHHARNVEFHSVPEKIEAGAVFVIKGV